MQITINGETWSVPASMVQSLVGWLNANAVKISSSNRNEGNDRTSDDQRQLLRG